MGNRKLLILMMAILVSFSVMISVSAQECQESASGYEVCDGRDNDCNGEIDTIDGVNVCDNYENCGVYRNRCGGNFKCVNFECVILVTSPPLGAFVDRKM